MMCYDKALRILARMEYPRPVAAALGGGEAGEAGHSSKLMYEEWIDRLVEKKFCHVVSAQVRCK